MSTKFAVRPAARKRPWICKRSPPCLKPPPYPLTLLCSFALQRREPPPAQPTIQGSLTLKYVGTPNRYNARWHQGFDYFDCWFHYDPTAAEGWAEAYWSAGPTSDHGNYAVRTILLPPTLNYTCAELQADNWDWWNRILVTS